MSKEVRKSNSTSNSALRSTRGRILQLLLKGYNQRRIAEKLGLAKSTVSYHVKCLREEKQIIRTSIGTYIIGPGYTSDRMHFELFRTPPQARATRETTYWNAIQFKARILRHPPRERLKWRGPTRPVEGVLHYFTDITLPIDGEEVQFHLQKSIGPRKQTMVIRIEPHELPGRDAEAHLEYLARLAYLCRKFLCNRCGYELGIVEYAALPEAEWAAEDLKGLIESYTIVSKEPDVWIDVTGPRAREEGIPYEGSRSIEYIRSRMRLVEDVADLKEQMQGLRETMDLLARHQVRLDQHQQEIDITQQGILQALDKMNETLDRMIKFFEGRETEGPAPPGPEIR